MLQAISIMVREGFEAALVIGIMLTYAAKTDRDYLKRPIALGALGAILFSVASAFTLNALGIEGENPTVEGALYLIAAVFVLTMVVWMWRTGGDVRRKITDGIDRVSTDSTATSMGVAAAAFFMVAREGIEAVLFMAANALDQGLVPTLVGSAIGIVIAVGLGVAIYYGAARIDMRLFFAATSVALLLLAARFVGIGILALGEAHIFALPEVAMDGLEHLEKGVLASVLSIVVVMLPLGSIGWSLVRNRCVRAAV